MEVNNAPVKASFIVPCYKVEDYLPKCLASLIGQTLQDIEIICINDGSPDHCLDILREWQKLYPNKIVIIDKKNEGVWRGRWDGIAVARGEYIGFLDSDDYAEPIFAESLYNTAKQSNADVAVGGFRRVDLLSGKILSTEMCDLRDSFCVEDDPGRLVELNGAPWNKLFKASILKNMRNLPSPPPVLDDLMFQWLAYLDVNGVVAFTPHPLVNYMVRSDSIIQTIDIKKVSPTYDAFKQVKQNYIDAKAAKNRLEAIDAAAFLHLGISLNYRLAADPSVDMSRVIEDCTNYLDTYFPTWRNSPYINGRYARTHGKTFQRLLTVSRFYKLGLLPSFLKVYGWVIENLGIDIKW